MEFNIKFEQIIEKIALDGNGQKLQSHLGKSRSNGYTYRKQLIGKFKLIQKVLAFAGYQIQIQINDIPGDGERANKTDDQGVINSPSQNEQDIDSRKREN